MDRKYIYIQASDDNKVDEEEGQNKVIPKWKASHITEIILEPEPEDEEETPAGEEIKTEAEPEEGAATEQPTTPPTDTQQEEGRLHQWSCDMVKGHPGRKKCICIRYFKLCNMVQ